MNESEKTLLKPGRAGIWVAGLLAVTVLAWLVLGVGSALASPVWWLVAAVPIVVFIALPFSLYWLSEGRTGPSWVAFVFAIVLAGSAFAVPAEWHMRAVGNPVTATVGDATCHYNARTGRCLYSYTLTGPDGTTLPGKLQETGEYPPGSSLEVITDPLGVFAPRLAVDLETTWVFEVAALVAFAGFAGAIVVAAVLGERRRRGHPAATAGRPTGGSATNASGGNGGRRTGVKRRPSGARRRR
ncbi:hypothetical protein AB0M79_17045 [Polymorphospora sp. NPDC051019]|uniref:hypothetical protein n=1 Tax=Polymorphospora sp. NPDC051019 TaxID=3155725 RepID=UPI00342D93E4